VEHVFFISFTAGLAALFALVEIQTEGPHGWAAHLPTWRIDNRFTRLVLSGKPLTGYHLYLLLFSLMMAHLPFAIDLSEFSWRAEARVISFLMIFWILEDFLWFVLNPHFGIRRFRREAIWWHAPAWWWIAPRDYWLWTPAAILLYLVSYDT